MAVAAFLDEQIRIYFTKGRSCVRTLLSNRYPSNFKCMTSFWNKTQEEFGRRDGWSSFNQDSGPVRGAKQCFYNHMCRQKSRYRRCAVHCYTREAILRWRYIKEAFLSGSEVISNGFSNKVTILSRIKEMQTLERCVAVQHSWKQGQGSQ